MNISNNNKDNESDVVSKSNYYSTNSKNDNDFSLSSDYTTPENNINFQSYDYNNYHYSNKSDKKVSKKYKEDTKNSYNLIDTKNKNISHNSKNLKKKKIVLHLVMIRIILNL